MENMSKLQFTDKLIIKRDDKEILDKINLSRNIIEDGLVWEAWIISFIIWIPSDSVNCDGVIDICFPVGENNSYGFLEVLEAKITKDSYGIYKLAKRGHDSDIPKQFYSIIEQNLLLPFSMGTISPYHDHVFGKGMVCKIAEIKSKEFRFALEDAVIISPFEHEKFIGGELNKSLPTKYEKKLKHKNKIDLSSMIKEGENEKCEFKSSSRWDYKQQCVNKELQKSILKTIVGFLNTSGGELLIGVNDDGSILGIENDIKTLKKKNLDGYQLFLSNLISDNIGKQFNSYVSIDFPNIDCYFICRLVIKKAKQASFLKDNSQSRFYIRTHNSTQELDSKETYEYISHHI